MEAGAGSAQNDTVMMKLFGFFRSSASYRVRIALNLKGLDCDFESVHLRRGGGEQYQPGFLDVNPQALVPALVDDEAVLTQSLAIIEYLDETHPEPPLLPDTAVARARVRAVAQAIACDIHPLNNLRVLQYLVKDLGHGADERDRWYRHWVEKGFAALEVALASHPATGRFCHGDQAGLADCFLVPQVYNAERFDVDISAFPTIDRINTACLALPAFEKATPENQPDAE